LIQYLNVTDGQTDRQNFYIIIARQYMLRRDN